MYAQPGFAIDWDWSAELTVWRTSHDRAGGLITTHQLDRRPIGEREAAVAAKRWWRHESSNVTRAAEHEQASEKSP